MEFCEKKNKKLRSSFSVEQILFLKKSLSVMAERGDYKSKANDGKYTVFIQIEADLLLF